MKRTATAQAAGRRLDVWLHSELPDLSRTRIQALIANGQITVPGRTIKANTVVTAGMTVTVNIPPPARTGLHPENIPLDILYEDGHLAAVNKPAGLVVHPAAGHPSGTLVNALLFHCRDLTGIGGELRPGIVHRLDKDTSGVLVVAKTDLAMEHLQAQFKRRKVHKEYLAVVHGTPARAAGTIDTLIGRARRDRKRMSARPASGRRAVTHYRVLESYDRVSLVAVRIDTGRTHQIRVHLRHIGHPVLGDRQYLARRTPPQDLPAAARQMLHAHRLSLCHPATGQPLSFEAPLPGDMQSVLDELSVRVESRTPPDP